MKKTSLALAVLAASLSPAHAAPEYDRTIEDAAKQALADRIGSLADTLRGTFKPEETPQFSEPSDQDAAPRFAMPVASYGRVIPLADAPRVDRVILTGSISLH